MKISSLFYSIQGEGHLVGIPMSFVRVQGCDVKCSIRDVCDEQSSLMFTSGTEYTTEEIVEFCKPYEWVCITGGEPMAHQDKLSLLVIALKKAKKKIMLQTSGYKEVRFGIDWLVVSPKCRIDRLKQTQGHELKIIYNPVILGEGILDWGMLKAFYYHTKFHHYYLQSLWGENAAVDAVMSSSNIGYQLSVQVHKYLELE